jgi:TatD DNase family protein
MYWENYYLTPNWTIFMKLIDSHCHLYLPEFQADIAETIKRALDTGVESFYLPAIDSQTNGAMLELEEQFPGKCKAMTGLHPCSVKADYLKELELVEALLERRRFAAIGETGLDFYWDRSFEKQQYESFRQQIRWALHYNLPVVIHSRESMEQCIKVVEELQDGRLRGIFHCFSGTIASAKQIVDLGFSLGIGGVLTYKKSGLAEVLKEIDLSQIVLETDAPYLPPVPFRGKRNESSYLPYIVQKLAEIKGISTEEIAEATTANAEKIFPY